MTVGIDISDFSLEAVVLDEHKGKFSIVAYSRFRLSPDIVSDGRILDMDKLRAAIKKLLTNAQPQAIKADRVFLSVPESRTFSRLISLSKKVKDKELQAAVRHRAEELIPESLDNLQTAMLPLPSVGDMRNIFFSAVDKDIINNLLSLFESLHIDIVGISTEAFSSFVGLSKQQRQKVTLLLDIGARTTIASVFDKNGIRDTININIAGNNITDVLVEKLGISHGQAEEQKQSVGLNVNKGNGEIMMMIQGQLQPLIDEIKRFMAYYEETHKHKIDNIVLIGGSAKMSGIDVYIGDNLGLPTTVGIPFIDDNKLGKDLNSLSFINALGLAKMVYSKTKFSFYGSKRSQRISKKVKKIRSLSLHDLVRGAKNIKPSKILFNKFFIISLVLLIVASLAWLFKNDIMRLFIVNEHNFSREFSVVVAGDSGAGLVVIADPYEISIEKAQILAATSYSQAIADIEEQATGDLLAGINNIYSKSNFYILPEVMSIDVVDSTQLSDFSPDLPVYIKVNYILMSVADEAVKLYVLDSLSEADENRLKQWDIGQVSYEIIDKRPDSLGKFNMFDIKANITLIKP